MTLLIAKGGFTTLQLRDNIATVFDDIMKNRPGKRHPTRFLERVELESASFGVINLDIREHLEKYKEAEVLTQIKRFLSREETWELRKQSKLKREKLELQKEEISEVLSERWAALEQNCSQ